MKPQKIMLQVTHCENTTSVRISDYRSMCFTESELTPDLRTGYVYVNDLSRLIIIQPYQIKVVHVHSDTPTQDGVFNAEGFVLHIDAARFFTILRRLREKKIDAEISVDDLRIKETPAPELTVVEMVRHPNATGDFSKTLVHFRKQLSDKYWLRLRAELSRYLTRARVYGQRVEFYFDGRRQAGGCGFNGGFIIHGDEFSIHT